MSILIISLLSIVRGATGLLTNSDADLAVGVGKASNHPVEQVGWWDVIKWCNARSEKDGLEPVYSVNGTIMRTENTEPTVNWAAKGYRLPTEAEWEKAARGGLSSKRFPWGDTISHSQANYRSDGSFAYDVSPTQGYHPQYAVGQRCPRLEVIKMHRKCVTASWLDPTGDGNRARQLPIV